jgi:5-aminopentanamidase
MSHDEDVLAAMTQWYGRDTDGRNVPVRRIRLAAYQGISVGGDADANLSTVQRVASLAAEREVDFLCFPETFLSGYGDRALIEQGALALDDSRLDDLAAALDRHDMVTLIGLSERLNDGRIGNSMLIFESGRRLGLYRKTMLTGADYKQMGFCTDWQLPVWQAKGVTFGCIVCADSSYVETALTMAYQGASLLFSPHFNCLPAGRMDQHRIRVRNNHIGLAALLEMYVVRANVIVPHAARGLGYGDSAIFDPDGRPIAEAGLFCEALITADALLPEPRAAGRSRLRGRVPLPVRDQLAAAMRGYPADEW